MYHLQFLSEVGNVAFEHESYTLVVLALIINVKWFIITLFGVDVAFTGLALALGFVLICRELDKNFYAFNSDRISTSSMEIRMIRIGTNLTAAFVAVTLNGVLGMTVFMQSPKGLFSFLSTWLSQLGLLGLGRLYFIIQEIIGDVQTHYYQAHQPQSQTQRPQQQQRGQQQQGQQQAPQQVAQQLAQQYLQQNPNVINDVIGQQVQRVINQNPLQGQGMLDINSLVTAAISNAMLGAGGVQGAIAQATQAQARPAPSNASIASTSRPRQ